MDDLGVIGAMSGVAIHDRWKPYRHYDVDHAPCNAHHLRELNAVGIG
jgi:transposase